MEKSSNPVNSIFSKLELECSLENEIIQLKEHVKTLESKIQEFEQKEIERTKLESSQSIMLYLHSDGAFMLCEEWQEKQFDSSSYICYSGNSAWGYGIKFKSIASMYTQLFRLGFKRVHESKQYYNVNGTTLPTEVWIKGM